MAENDDLDALLEPFRESVEWLAPERIWRLYSREFRKVVEPAVEAILQQLHPHFATADRLQAKSHKPLGCYSPEHNRTVDAPFRNTTTGSIDSACVMAHPKENAEVTDRRLL